MAIAARKVVGDGPQSQSAKACGKRKAVHRVGRDAASPGCA